MIIPTKNQLLIRPIDKKEQMVGKIFIPACAEKRGGQGVIIAMGRKFNDTGLEVGYTVLYKDWAGVEITSEGIKYNLLEVDDVLAIVNENGIDDLGVSTAEEAQKYFKSILQPFRHGEFSKEFAESYPEQVEVMIKTGRVVKGEVKDAKYLYKNVPGWKEWKKGKTK